MTADPWRVILATGEVRRVLIEATPERYGGAWCAGSPADGYGYGATQRGAVVDLCAVSSWDAAEILAPDELSASERVAAGQARCIAACRAVLDSCVVWSDGAQACIAEIKRSAK